VRPLKLPCYDLNAATNELNESAKDFADRFLEEAERAGRGTDSALLHQFIRSLNPDLKLEVTRQRPSSMEEAIEFCSYWTGANADNGHDDRVAFSNAKPPVNGQTRWSDRSPRNNPPPFANPQWQQNGRNNQQGGRPRNPFSYGHSNTNGYPPRANNQGRPPFSRPFQAHQPPQGRAPNTTAAALDDLTRQMGRLQINLQQTTAENNRLRAALRQSGGPSDENIGIMEDTEFPCNPYDFADDSYCDQFMVKRPQPDGDNLPYTRMPHKRVAINPSNQTPYMAPRAATPPAPPMPPHARDDSQPGRQAAAAELDHATRRMPRGRIPFQAAPYPSNPTAAAAAQRPASQRQDAASLANDKGRDIAEQLGKVKVDARKEAAVLPKAIMFCAAGHMVGDAALIDKGKALAREVEAVVRRIAPGQPILANMAASDRNPAPILSSPNSECPIPVLNHQPHTLSEISTCKVQASLAGQPLEAVVDTGASTCAVTLDCLRRADL